MADAAGICGLIVGVPWHSDSLEGGGKPPREAASGPLRRSGWRQCGGQQRFISPLILFWSCANAGYGRRNVDGLRLPAVLRGCSTSEIGAEATSPREAMPS